MAKVIPVSYENQHCYNIQIEKDFSDFIQALQRLNYKPSQKVCIITDSNVNQLYGTQIKESLCTYFEGCTVFEFKAGEEQKHLDTVYSIYQHLIENSFDRKDLLIALGGGVVGDITGFTASTYLRGIDFVQVPTTLLSQVDSSIGGKTGVDFLQYKNMVGAFYMPKLVYINTGVLSSLPKRQFASGMGEIIKHGLIKSKDYFKFIEKQQEDISDLNSDVLEELIYQSCQIKREVVEKDPKEMGERALLNFGHTVGHAIEKLSDFVLAHGECVALGTVCASYISYKNETITKEELTKIEQLMQLYSLPIRLKHFEHTQKEILDATKKDKKMEAGKVKFILLQSIGEAYVTKELTDEQIRMGISYLFSE